MYKMLNQIESIANLGRVLFIDFMTSPQARSSARDDKKEKVLAEKGLLPKDRPSFSKLEVDEVAVAEEAQEDDGVEARVVGQGAKDGPGPDSWDACRMRNPPLDHEHRDDR
ncbi:MAG: hypothetical protein QOH35_933 [Acidobacteriaceae bacterium]|nr:hypothetical protein [Acidobacteriaceae bacterium]